MAPAPTLTSRRSARARAQRPQLVPREQASTPTAAPRGNGGVPSTWRGANGEASVDLDAQVAEGRTAGVGDEWHAPSPEEEISPTPTPSPAPTPTPATPPALDLRPVTYEDLDRMWDWARQDADGARRFFGEVPTHSQAMFAWFQKLMQAESAGTALLRSIAIAGPQGAMHIGFIALMPLSRTTTPAIGQVHCYLAPLAQGSLPHLLPQLLDIAAAEEPELTLVVTTTDYAFAKLLQPHGFHLSIALTRPPNARK